MIKYAQSNHIQQIIAHEQALSDKLVIAIAKGFGIGVVQALGAALPTLSDWSVLIVNDRIQVSRLRESSSSLLPSLFQMDPQQRQSTLLMYEELLLLMENLRGLNVFPNLNFLIIENDLFDEIKNPSSLDLKDVENLMDSSIQGQFDHDDTNVFYSFGKKRDTHVMVQYYDPDFSEEANCTLVKLSEVTPPVSDRSSQGSRDLVPLEYPLSIDVQLTFENNEWDLPDQISWVLPREMADRIEVYSHFNRLNHFLQTLGIDTQTNPAAPEVDEAIREAFSDILRTYWKSDAFRQLTFYKTPGANADKYQLSQAAIIEEVVRQSEQGQKSGNSKDIFLTAPTGAGKSVLFQVPAIYLARQYGLVTIILSPLKALMEDQVSALHQRGFDGARFLNSDQTLIEREEILNDIQSGKLSLLYLSPELLMSYSIEHFLGERKLGFFVIDEAHLVTTWGRDFRVDYWFLGTYIKHLRKNSETNFPILAVTATAPYNGDNDLVFETIESLNMHQPIIKVGNVRRDDIAFEINHLKSEGNHEEQKVEQTASRIREYVESDRKSIIYCPWRVQVDTLIRAVDTETRPKTGRYFSTVPAEERREVVEGLKTGALQSVLATKAFGMGIDIDDIEIVYHHAVNGGLPDYVQEIGRAARRKDIQGKAITDYERRDLKFFKILFGLSSVKNYQIRLVIEKLYKLYQQNKNSKKLKRANLLVATEDFIQIFGEDAASERVDDTKVKSALLLIERDFLNRYPYPVIIVRPKLLFSSVYGMVRAEHLEQFKNVVGKHCQLIKASNRNAENEIFEIRLNEIWEEHFQQQSFPMVKRMFFQEELFQSLNFEVSPKFKIEINIEVELEQLLDQLEILLNQMNLGFIAMSGRFFLKKELISKLVELGMSKPLAERSADVYLSLFSKRNDNHGVQTDRFIQEKRVENESQYRILRNGYTRLHQGLKDDAIKHFTSKHESSKTFFTSIAPEKSRRTLKLAYLLEVFQLASHTFEGGRMPMLFIRINDPLKLFREYNKLDKYRNGLVTDIQQKHKRNVKIMEHFFESAMTDQQRWDFIEDYFLGKELAVTDQNS